MLQPAIYKAKIKDQKQITWKVVKLTLTYTKPTKMNFIPGQFINLRCPNGHYRAYSISSDYKNRNELYILVEVGHDGLGSNYVKGLKIGEDVEFIGPSGKLSLQEPLPKELKFFATGTGVAPFISMFHRLVDIGYNGAVELFLGSRTENEILEEIHIKMFKTQLPNFKYTFYISKSENSETKSGHVTDALNDLSNFSKTARYYVCGHPSMVEDVINALKINGIDRNEIIVEEFSHSGS